MFIRFTPFSVKFKEFRQCRPGIKPTGIAISIEDRDLGRAYGEWDFHRICSHKAARDKEAIPGMMKLKDAKELLLSKFLLKKDKPDAKTYKAVKRLLVPLGWASEDRKRGLCLTGDERIFLHRY
jgi:hypothetical protein